MGVGHGPSVDPHAVAELADTSLDTMGWRMGPEAEGGDGEVKREEDGGDGVVPKIPTGLGSSRSRERREREMEREREKEKERDAPPCHTFTAFVWSCSLMKKSRQIMALMWVLFRA